MNAIIDYFMTTDLAPHGYCLAWHPGLVATHVVSDSLVSLAYFSLPIFLIVLLKRRSDIQFNWMIMMFAIFILMCGVTHVFNIWTLWTPDYAVQGVVKAFTALASIATAIAAWPLLPKLLAIPSPSQLASANAQLEAANSSLVAEGERRQGAERVLRRQAVELNQTNESLAIANAALSSEVEARRLMAKELQLTSDSLKDNQVELKRSNEDLESFAYIASHDLKAPLRAIDNLSIWIEEDLEEVLSDESRENMNLLRDRVGRMTALLDDLLAYSRIGSKRTKVVEVDTGTFVQETFDMVNADGRFSLKADNDLPDLTAPPAMLRLVFGNLMANSMKHHDAGAGTISVSSTSKEDFVEFAVSDDGPGIPKEHHDRVFEMFQTLAPRDKIEGSGMGLAAVKKAVATVGGSIWLESGTLDGDRGLTVHFTWPTTVRAEEAA